MSALTDTFTLNNNTKIPRIGFGTWQIPEGDEAYTSTAIALKNGYRHIDTALVYGNEKSVGQAIRDSGIDRSEIYVTTKLPASVKTYEGALEGFETSMQNLGLDYIDLYLIHAPWPWDEMGADYRKEDAEVWKAFEEIYKTGKVKAIGVSNFNVLELETLFETAEIIPAVNQIRYFIGHTQDDVVALCKEKGILVEGYSPLATGALLDNEKVEAIAQKYEKTVAQVSIRFVLQNGILPLPKSTNEGRIIQNADVDFEISEEDMKYLNSLKDIASN
jgi:diketogulonate reductase-like aldo/keto reductase